MIDISIQIIDREGNMHKVIAPTDMNMNLMEVCKSYGFPIEGICGGMALCASCQVYVNSEIHLASPNEEEEAMLSEAFHVQENSRLGCQMHMNSSFEGLIVTLAPE